MAAPAPPRPAAAAAPQAHAPAQPAQPALPAHLYQVPYAEPSYWEARYGREHQPFEWFLGYTALRRVLRAFLSKRKPVLQIGCGTSNVQEGMAKAGWSVVNVDIAHNIIEQLKELHQGVPGLSYAVADCRDMPQYTDCEFGGVLDKGTIDALLCAKDGVFNVSRMLSEASRVLTPGGTFLLVSLGDPARRLCLLCSERYDWTVQVLLLPKIAPDNQATVGGRAINDTLQPVDFLGPFEVLDSQTIVGLPKDVDYSRFFFGYVCKKRRLQLSSHPEQRQRLPQGWVRSSRALVAKLQEEMGLPADLLSRGRRTRHIMRPRTPAAAGEPGGLRTPSLDLQARAAAMFANGASGGAAAASDSGVISGNGGAAYDEAGGSPTYAESAGDDLLLPRTQSVPNLAAQAPPEEAAAAAPALGRGTGPQEQEEQEQQQQQQQQGAVEGRGEDSAAAAGSPVPVAPKPEPATTPRGPAAPLPLLNGHAAAAAAAAAAWPAGAPAEPGAPPPPPPPPPPPRGAAPQVLTLGMLASPLAPRPPGSSECGASLASEDASDAGTGSTAAVHLILESASEGVAADDDYDGDNGGDGGAAGPGARRAPAAAARMAGLARAARARRHSAPPTEAAILAMAALMSEPCLPPEPPGKGVQRLAECDAPGEAPAMAVGPPGAAGASGAGAGAGPAGAGASACAWPAAALPPRAPLQPVPEAAAAGPHSPGPTRQPPPPVLQ